MTGKNRNTVWGVILVTLLVALAIGISMQEDGPGGAAPSERPQSLAVLCRQRADFSRQMQGMIEARFREASADLPTVLRARELAELAELQALRAEADLSTDSGASELLVKLECANALLNAAESSYRVGTITNSEVLRRRIDVLELEIEYAKQSRDVIRDERFLTAAREWRFERTPEKLKALASAEFAVGAE